MATEWVAHWETGGRQRGERERKREREKERVRERENAGEAKNNAAG
jgi:hypothetical protein